MTILHAFAYYTLGSAAGFVIGWQTARREAAKEREADHADPGT